MDYSCGTMQDKEYERLMQSLNLEQSEICIHLMGWILRVNHFTYSLRVEQVLEKLMLQKQYISQWKGFMVLSLMNILTHCIVLVPTGMASYHVKGNTLYSGLHIDLNKAKATPLGNSEKNTLCPKYFETKAVFLWWNVYGR